MCIKENFWNLYIYVYRIISKKKIYIYIKFCFDLSDLFRLRGCEKVNEKCTFLLYFLNIFSKINLIFAEMKIDIVMSIYSYLFPMYLLRKAILFFPYSLTLKPSPTWNSMYSIYLIIKYSLLSLINYRKYFWSCNQLNLELGHIGAISDCHSLFKLNMERAYSDEW